MRRPSTLSSDNNMEDNPILNPFKSKKVPCQKPSSTVQNRIRPLPNRRLLFSATVLLALVLLPMGTSGQPQQGVNPWFDIVWNFPSDRCSSKFNASIQVEKYGILANQDQKFLGDQIVVFYHKDLGLYPYIKNGELINGGIPQAVKLAEHIRKVREDIATKIPDPNFKGLGVIDWEAWRPVFNANWGKQRAYKKLSINREFKRHPSASHTALRTYARRAFNKAARKMMIETLNVAKSMRPFAKWGYYGFPMCHHQDKKLKKCSRASEKCNRRWMWMFEHSTALFPSIYMKGSMQKHGQHWRHVHMQILIREALYWAKFTAKSSSFSSRPSNRLISSSSKYGRRQRKTVTKRPIPVIPYSKVMYDTYDKNGAFYEKSDLCSSIKQATDLGCAGVILWSSSYSVATADRCQRISEYVDFLLGPYALIINDQVKNCALKQCSAHGSCTISAQDNCSTISPYKHYTCKCKHPYSGKHCEKFTKDYRNFFNL